MDTLVVWFSHSGHTAWAAERIGQTLGADLLPIRPVKAYPARGAALFLAGGRSALMEEKPLLQPYEFREEKYDQVILGFPVWAGNVAPPLRSFLAENRDALMGKRLAAFACQSGSGAEKAFRKLSECLGAEKLRAELILTDPGKKQPDDRAAKIADFCEKCR